MDGPFIPLKPHPSSAAPAAAPGRLKFIAAGQDPQSFQSVSQALPSLSPTAPPPGAIQAPTITLKRDGDRVTHIRVQCACGQIVELECLYS